MSRGAGETGWCCHVRVQSESSLCGAISFYDFPIRDASYGMGLDVTELD